MLHFMPNFICIQQAVLMLCNGSPVLQPSVYDLAFQPRFASLPIVPEDFIKQHGGQYSCQ